jgi:M6 family metalloprotease-like protein
MLIKNLFKTTALSLLLCSGLSVYAAPAYPGPITWTNPDGSTVTIRMHGDEWFNFVTTEDGTLITKADDGFYHYATVVDGVLVATKYVVSDDALPEEIAAMDQTAMKNQLQTKKRVKKTDNKRYTYSDITDESIYDGPTKGTGCYPVILVQFPDQKLTYDKQMFEDMLMKEGYNYTSELGTPKGSIRDYYLTASNNQFSPQFDVYGPYTASHEHDYYGYVNGDERAVELLIETITYLSEKGDIDFSKYDNNNDGTVDIVYMIFAGPDYADTGNNNNIWSMSWEIYMDAEDYTPLILNGKKIFTYSCSSEMIRGKYFTTIGTFCHEFGHALGLRDYYNTAYNGYRHPLYWDIMAAGSNIEDGCAPPLFNAYERSVLGWMKPTPLTSAGSYTLMPNALSENYNSAYIIPTDRENEYYIFENRQKVGWDYALPHHGMLVWHIDYDKQLWFDNIINTTEHQHVDLVEAGGVENTDETYTPFPGAGGYNAFTDDTTPSMIAWSGARLNSPITNITEHTDGSITFDFKGGIEGVSYTRLDADIEVSVDGLNVSVNAPDDTLVAVYTIDGSTVASCRGNATITLPSQGIYIVKAGKQICKLAVK